MTSAGDGPRPPRELRRLPGWLWRLLKEIAHEYGKDGVGDAAAAITFWTLLSVPAAALSIISTLSSFERIFGQELAQDFRAEIESFIARTFTSSAAINRTISELFETPSTGVATVATAVALFSLSRAFAGLIRALDNAYGVEDGRPFWLVRLLGIALAIGTVALVVAATTLLAILPALPLAGWLQVLTVPLVLAAMVLWVAVLFHVAPHHRTPLRFELPGAVFTVVGWIAATQLFALYVRIAGDGNQLRSSVGAVLLALTLAYFLAVVLLVGAELNDVIAKRAGVIQQPVPLRRRARRLVTQLRARGDAADRSETPEGDASADRRESLDRGDTSDRGASPGSPD